MGEGPVPCPMPVVRQGYEDDDVTFWRRLEVCGEPLCVVATGTGEIWNADGEVDGCDDNVTQWRVECHQGHVLLIPDIEDSSITWEESGNEWLPALASIRWSTDG